MISFVREQVPGTTADPTEALPVAHTAEPNELFLRAEKGLADHLAWRAAHP